MAFDKTKFLKKFVEEAREHIQSINKGLLVLEENPGDAEIINDIFRSAHTIKGSSKIMKLTAVSGLAHRLEDALDALRQGGIEFSDTLSDLLFKSVDAIDGMLDEVTDSESAQALPEELCLDLEQAAKGRLIGLVVPKKKIIIDDVSIPAELAKEVASEEVVSEPNAPSKNKKISKQKDSTVRISEEKLDTLIKLMGEIVSAQTKIKLRMFEFGEIGKLTERVKQKMDFLEGSHDNKHEYLINSVNNLSAEIIKIRNGMNDDIIVQDHLTNELQDTSLKMRMFPVSTVFNTYHRVVRDIAKTTGKKINFSVKGDETELDKKIIEKLSDPLIHMIRNAIGHGIEEPAVRVATGKAEIGNMELTAEYEGGNVLIKLIDDGAGIPLEKIKRKAVSRKLYTEAELDGLSEKQIVDLIFHPGFSTSELITDISGRGVGMDVVHTNIIGDLSGSIRVLTKEGRGTTFEIRLPLTLAVMHMIVIEVSDLTVAIPSTHVDEIVRVAQTDIIDVVDKKAIKLREQIVPVVKLSDVLGLDPADFENDSPLIMIVSVGNEKMGLIIGSLLREENRTVKALPAHMKNNPFVSGVTISGNRMLDNVLNIPKIMEYSKNVKERILHESSEEKAGKINILVVDDSISTREIEKSILESYGYNVSLAADGIEALESADEFQYDLVITDIEMPRMNGLSLTKELKSKDNYKDIPVILISSRDQDEDKRKGLKVGADAYIVKDDFDQTGLIDVIQNLVGG